MATQKILDFVLSPLETGPIIQGMESKINTEVAIVSRIAELSYDPTLSDSDIQGIIWTEFKETRGLLYIAQVIADFIADQYEEREMSDEGYDPYLNTYTDDC